MKRATKRSLGRRGAPNEWKPGPNWERRFKQKTGLRLGKLVRAGDKETCAALEELLKEGTQAQAAEFLGVSQRTIANLVRVMRGDA